MPVEGSPDDEGSVNADGSANCEKAAPYRNVDGIIVPTKRREYAYEGCSS
jgi:hypothetical protein